MTTTSAKVGGASETPLRLGRETVLNLVRSQLDDPAAEVPDWTEQALHGGASNSVVVQLAGVAAGADGPQPWSMAVKFLRVGADDWQFRGLEPSHWRYWKRDWHVYQAPWVTGLDPSFQPPRIYGLGELNPDTAWIAMEHLASEERWPLDRFPQVARILGRMNGRFLTGRPLPNDPWLTRDYVRMYVDLAEPVLNQFTELAKAPPLCDIYSPDAVADLLALWADREQFHAALATCPQVFSHFDVFTRNAFLSENDAGELQVTAIDWELCGVVPVGGELSPLTGSSLAFADLSPEDGEQVAADCLDAYLDGLADVGAVVSPTQVEFAFLATNTLRNALGGTVPVVNLLHDPRTHPLAEQVFGSSVQAVVENSAAYVQILQSQIHRARLLLSELHPATPDQSP